MHNNKKIKMTAQSTWCAKHRTQKIKEIEKNNSQMMISQFRNEAFQVIATDKN